MGFLFSFFEYFLFCIYELTGPTANSQRTVGHLVKHCCEHNFFGSLIEKIVENSRVKQRLKLCCE